MSKYLRILIVVAFMSLGSISIVLINSSLDLVQALIALSFTSLAFLIIIGLFVGLERGITYFEDRSK